MVRMPRSFTTVLAATDFSPDAGEAVARACQLAARHGARLILVHVVDASPWLMLQEVRGGQPDLQTKMMEQAEIELAAAAAELERQGHGIAIRTVLSSGRPVATLFAATASADLVVTGASGDHPVRDVTLGSTAEQLSRLVSRPLLVARGVPAGPYRHVLAAIDFSDSATAALEQAMALAPDASIHLLHCIDLPYLGRMKLAGVDEPALNHYRERSRRNALDQLRELASTLPRDRRVTMDAVVADVRFELLQQARTLGADLIAIGKQGRSFVAEALLGSVSAFTLAHAECDVLVVPSAFTAPSS